MRLALATTVATVVVAMIDLFFAAIIAAPVTILLDAPTWAGVMFALTLAAIYGETRRCRNN